METLIDANGYVTNAPKWLARSLGHEAWVEAYFRPRPDSFDAELARRFPCVCDDCESSRTRNRTFRGA